eukprot:jgi/Ulvmu1/11099/UM070_0014.1
MRGLRAGRKRQMTGRATARQHLMGSVSGLCDVGQEQQAADVVRARPSLLSLVVSCTRPFGFCLMADNDSFSRSPPDMLTLFRQLCTQPGLTTLSRGAAAEAS